MPHEKSIIEQLSGMYFQRLCDSAGIGLLSVDRDLQVGYCNDKAACLLDLSVEGMIGVALHDVVGRFECGAQFERLARRAADRGESSDFEFSCQPQAGAARFLAVTFSPINDAAGTSLGASICIRDITCRMQLQRQQGQSGKMRALGTMAGNFAHHFNNILGGVVTSVDFAKESNDLRVLHKTLNNTAAALQRATRLLGSLLAFAEADYRDGDYADLSETLFQFVEQIEPELAKANVALELKLSRVRVVEVPKNQFVTVLSNMVDNAVEAMPGGGRLCIELVAEPEAVVCRMTDSGAGIAGTNIERVFEPFYSTKRDVSGSQDSQHPGLGLSVAMGIIHELGGEISISSRPGQSTVVEIKLPLDSACPIRLLNPSETGVFDDMDQLPSPNA